MFAKAWIDLLVEGGEGWSMCHRNLFNRVVFAVVVA